MNIKRNKMQSIENDILFETIAKHIIQKVDPNETRYILKKYHDPNYHDPFQINKEDLA